MRISDIFKISLKVLSSRKVRSILTILSIVVGVAAIVALISQTTGVGESITSTLQRMGPDTVIVMGSRLTDVDVATISSLSGIKSVIPIISTRGNIYLGSETISATIIGINEYGLEQLLGTVNLLEGMVYPSIAAPLALVGYQVAFPQPAQQQEILTGQTLYLQIQEGQRAMRVSMQVIGVLAEYGASAFIQPDTSIFIPLQAAQTILNRKWYNMLVIKTINVDEVNNVVDMLRNLYGNSLNILSAQQITQTFQSIIGQISLLLGGIAAISLIVASLGILNIMLITVIERTKEIGTLKAIGFKNKHILLQILIEGFLIGIIGAGIGIISGSAISYLIPTIFTFRMGRNPQAGRFGGGIETGGISYTPIITPETIIIAFALAVTVSMISSLYPAWRASKMDPIKALRYE